MKYYGDIPASDRKLINELIALEKWFDEGALPIPEILAAKGFTAMSHDYYEMYLDEEGERLLNRAEKCYPGYFKHTIQVHMDKCPDFNSLIAAMKKNEALEVMKSLGFKS